MNNDDKARMRDEALTVCAELLLTNVLRGDAQGIVEAMSENKKKWLAEAIVQAFECHSDRVPVEVVAFSTDDGMGIDSINGLPDLYDLSIQDRDA